MYIHCFCSGKLNQLRPSNINTQVTDPTVINNDFTSHVLFLSCTHPTKTRRKFYLIQQALVVELEAWLVEVVKGEIHLFAVLKSEQINNSHEMINKAIKTKSFEAWEDIKVQYKI